jgi:hypothetical protein
MGDMGDASDKSPVSVSPMNLDGEQGSTSDSSSDSDSTSSSSDSSDSNECWRAVSDEAIYTEPAESATTWTAQKKDGCSFYCCDVVKVFLPICTSAH